jgi:hypothetical protein
MFNPFAVLKVLPKLFKRVASGEVLASDETTANFGYSRLRLTAKREAGSGEVYAVLSTISSDQRQHFHLNARELDEFANIARAMQSAARAGQPSGAFGASAAPDVSPRRIGKGRIAAPGTVWRIGILIASLLLIALMVRLLQRPDALFGALR